MKKGSPASLLYAEPDFLAAIESLEEEECVKADHEPDGNSRKKVDSKVAAHEKGVAYGGIRLVRASAPLAGHSNSASRGRACCTRASSGLGGGASAEESAETEEEENATSMLIEATPAAGNDDEVQYWNQRLSGSCRLPALTCETHALP